MWKKKRFIQQMFVIKQTKKLLTVIIQWHIVIVSTISGGDTMATEKDTQRTDQEEDMTILDMINSYYA